MSPIKQEAIRIIQGLPDDCSYEDIQYHLYVRESFEAGLRDIEAGRVVSQNAAELRVQSWFKSSGPNER